MEMKETPHPPALEALPVCHWPEFLQQHWPPHRLAEAFGTFQDTLSWRQDTIVLFGRRVLQPRLVAFHADDGVQYRYSGHALPHAPWTPLLLELKALVEAQCQMRFNSVLCNWYRNGQDSMGWHADDEKSLGPKPIIASLSLGATRTFLMRRKMEHAVRGQFYLSHGSLLLMQGDCQENWQHAVPKTKAPVGPRLNFTFRRLFTARELSARPPGVGLWPDQGAQTRG